MNPLVRRNNAAELQAFDTVCTRLGGFDGSLSFEFIDGYLTALVAGPQLPPVEQWLPALCGDAFERAFADPDDQAQALRALRTRLAVLQDQLDPEALFDDPDALRLEPLMAEWTEADRAEALARGDCPPEDAWELHTGALWAIGFRSVLDDFPALWVEPGEDEAGAALYVELLSEIDALGPPPEAGDTDAAPEPPETREREAMVTDALYAVQDLRLWWVEHAPKPVTRRVEPAPGRNDPCPCGSGKKYKKCHGAAA